MTSKQTKTKKNHFLWPFIACKCCINVTDELNDGGAQNRWKCLMSSYFHWIHGTCFDTDFSPFIMIFVKTVEIFVLFVVAVELFSNKKKNQTNCHRLRVSSYFILRLHSGNRMFIYISNSSLYSKRWKQKRWTQKTTPATFVSFVCYFVLWFEWHKAWYQFMYSIKTNQITANFACAVKTYFRRQYPRSLRVLSVVIFFSTSWLILDVLFFVLVVNWYKWGFFFCIPLWMRSSNCCHCCCCWCCWLVWLTRRVNVT